MKPVQATSLYFKEGSSDKEYHTQIQASGSGYVVNFQYGRRGGTLQTGTKTESPVSLKDAEKIYNKLVKEKTSKGYTASETGKVFSDEVGAAVAQKSTISLQLLNPVTEAEMNELLKNDDYIAQQKHDGERRAVEKKEGISTGINRKSLTVALPQVTADSIYEDGIYDAEIIGDKLYVFDLLELDGKNFTNKPLEARLAALQNVDFGEQVVVVETAITTEEKTALLAKVKAAGGEGIVFKKKTAKYTPGRPNSGGDQFKYKLYKTATFIVGSLTKGKKSVGLVVLDGLNEVEVGKVTIPASHQVPSVGDVVEVRYLYANRGGAVYQPVYLGARTDLDSTDAVIEQLEYKNEEVA
jgi:bifunctional non-homologous end joining protein LigD